MEAKIHQILAGCEAEGVVLQVVDGNLQVSYDDELSDALLELLKANKPALVEFLVAQQVGAGLAPAAGAIERLPRDGRTFPLSYGQERLWFIDALEGSVHYNMPGAFTLKGELDRAAFARAMQAIVARHEVLRTRLVASDGETWQVVEAAVALPLREIDLGHWDAPARATEVERLVREEAQTPFVLSEALKLRVSLIRLGEAEHVVVFNLHHVAADGWSIGVLVQEFGALYRACRAGVDDPLPRLPLQYADYAHWQRGWQQRERLAFELDYWKRQLVALPDVHSLPLDRPRPALQRFAGATQVQRLDASLLGEMRAFCRRQDVTLFMVLQTALAVLLGRYGNTQDVVMGTPIAGRVHRDTEGLIGLFVNSLVLRTDLSDTDTFEALLARNKAMILDAYAHQHVPFEMLVEALRPERSLAYGPLFQVLITMQNPQAGQLDLDGVVLESTVLSDEISKFDLELSLIESEAGLQLTWRYNTALFEGATVTRLMNSFVLLLETFVANPQQSVHALSLLSAAEQAQLAQWNATAAAYPHDHCVHALIEAQVERTPDAAALEFDEVALSYRELNERANRLAHCLIAQGVVPGALVGLCVTRSADMVVALLAILKAGGAYVPLDARYPQQRIASMLDDSGAALVVSESRLLDSLPIGVPTVCLDDATLRQRLDAAPTHNPVRSGLGAGDLAYVIFTSGSTGRPKGVMIEHRAVCNTFTALHGLIGLTPQQRWLAVTSISFDIAALELYSPLVAGATVVICPDDVASDAFALGDYLVRSRASVLQSTPAMWSALLGQSDWQPGAGFTALCGGEALGSALHARFLACDAAVWNVYGPTETTIWSTLADARAMPRVTIGRPIANTRLHVVDDRGNHCPIGAPGELLIGGASLARGYLNQPELTVQKFIADPFGSDPWARLYRTGDLARWLPDGTVEFIGRIDSQVKIRGFRIELGEIETVLGTADGVRDAVVIAREVGEGDKRLVAYVVANRPTGDGDERQQRVAQWRQHLETQLPAYMLPDLFVLLDALPLTGNGKVDRRALPAPQEGDLGRAGYAAPRTQSETRLCELWQNLLKLERVGIDDNFFALGGHSLLATRLVSLVRKAFAIELPLRALFETPTVRGLARALQAQAAQTVLPAILHADRAAALPLSYAQQRLWFIHQLQGDVALYNMRAALRLDGELDVAAFDRAIRRIVERHESLRTRLVAVDGEARQVVDAHAAPTIAHDDLSALDPAAQDAQIAQLLQQEARTPFDLAAPLKLRVRLLRLADAAQIVLFTLHHAAADGWSVGLLVNEFSALYTAFVAGHADPLPPLPVQYADYAQWQRSWLQGPVLAAQVDYWKTQLSGLPPVHGLPLDRPRPPVQSFAAASHDQRLDAGLTADLRALCQAQDVTLFMALQTVLSVFISRYSHDTDVVMSTAIAGRRHSDLDALIGMFVNDLVLRSDLSDNPHFDVLLGHNKRMILDAYAHQDVPFEALLEELRPARNLSHAAVAQIKLDLQNNAQGELNLPGLRLSALPTGSAVIDKDLYLSVSEIEGTLALSWQYNTDLFEAATIRRWAASFAHLLRGVIATPQAAIGSLPLLDVAERRALVAQGQGPVVAIDTAFVHERIEAQVRATPAAVALEYGSESLSYADLNAQANRLAHYLASQGVGRGSRVGLCAERSPDLVVGVLAVLKAGAAYVPLDAAYPAARLAQVLDDAGCTFVLAHSHLQADLPLQDRRVFPLDEEMREALLRSQPATDPGRERSGLHPDDLAYLIYTSGSTGTPKGVMVSQANLASYVSHAVEAYGTDVAGSVVSLSLAFDATVTTLFVPLCLGLRQILLPDGAQVIEALEPLLFEATQPLLFKLTPAHLEALAQRDTPRVSPTPHVLVLGGEALSVAAVRTLGQHLPHATVINEYGPTEATVGCSVHGIAAAGACGETLHPQVPIGRPIANTQLYVCDAWGELVPVGVAGELHIGGAGVTRGYWQRDAQTAQAFIADPFTGGGRLYRTGDLVRWRDDGELEFLGRRDAQVKLRGYRIELGEIEAQLAATPGVREAVVLVRQDEGSDKRLVAYLVAVEPSQDEGERQRLVAACKQHVQAQLPAYMVPELYVQLDAIPLTNNGKVDRKALPAPHESDLQKAVYQAPTSQTEAQLCELWQSVLKLDQVGIDDNFFNLGGHSLLATRLVSEVRKIFARELPLRVLFEHPTVRGMAGALQDMATGPVLPAITPVARDVAQPLSHAQQRLWFIEQFDEGSALYNIPGAFRLDGVLDVTAFERAMRRIVERHEVLRTRIETIDGRAQARIEADAVLPLPRLDLSDMDASAQDAQVQRLLEKEARTAFDLAAPLKLRVCLLRLAPESHVVLFTLHHIAADGWSLGVLVGEFSALYSAFARGEADPLPELGVQYADYAHWQRSWLQGGVLSEQVDYWKKQLDRLPQVHSLPLDRPRPFAQSFAAAGHWQWLDASLSAGLRALCQAQDVTLFMALQTALAVFIARCSRETDVVMSTVIAGRRHSDLDPLIGMFVNDLVLRSDLDGNPPFTQALARNKAMILDAYAHQDLPFEMLLEELRPQRTLSHAAVAQIKLDLQNNDGGALALPGLTLTSLPGGGSVIDKDLHLTASEAGDRLVVNWQYNADLFEAETIARWADSFAELLRSIVTNPKTAIESLDMALAGDCEQIAAWNATDGAYPDAVCMHALVEAQVARTPDAIALVSEGERLSYRALNARANRLAHRLIGEGVGPDTIVGLCAERSLELVVGLLAIVKAGGAYLPLDPSYPPARLAYLLQDSAATRVLAQASLCDTLAALTTQPVLTLAADPDPAWPDTNPVVAGLTNRHLAYVIYTSGSTGQPKGVLTEHRALVNRIDWMQATYALDASDTVLQKTPYSFDVSVWEFFWPLSTGATLVMARPEGHKDPDYLVETIRREGVTTLHYVPSMLAAMLAQGEWATCTGVRRVFCSGEALPLALVRAFYTTGTTSQLHNLYGPTEAAIDVSYWDCAGHASRSAIPIGRPIRNTQLHVLSATGQVQPVGVPGELHIGGIGLARGYLNKPELTAQTFIADPFGTDPQARLYKTGDLARWLPDGTIEYLGRIDHQVKLRGFRIELGEIENALGTVDAVREAVVVARTEAAGEQRLVAYLVPHAATDSDEARQALITLCKQQLQTQLPAYMVPEQYVLLAAMPLSGNGKVDRKALPAPQDGDRQVAGYVAPRTATEEALCELWQSVLKREPIGVDDNFFALGGDSIVSIQVVSRAKQRGMHFSVRDLFERQTIAQLAPYVNAHGAVVETEQGEVEGPLALLPIQRRFFGQAMPVPNHYNQAVLLETPTGFDPGAQRALIEALYRRHDALRLRFRGTGAAVSAEHVPFDAAMLDASVVHHDLSAVLPGERAVQVEALCNAAQASLDIAHGPLCKAVWFDYGHGEGRLLLAIHHLAVDGVSWRILLTDLELAWAQLQRGEAITLAPKTSSLRQWGEAVQAYAQSGALAQERRYWLDQLALPVTPLPRTGNVRGEMQSFGFRLDAEATQLLLGESNKAYRTQVNELLLAALLKAFQQWSAGTTLCLQMEGHGREALFEQLDTNETVGWFTTVYPLLLSVEREADLGTLIKSVKEQYRGLPHRGFGYGVLSEIVRDGDIRAAGERLAGQGIEFNYLGQFDATINRETRFSAAGEAPGQTIAKANQAAAALTVNSGVHEGRLSVTLTATQPDLDATALGAHLRDAIGRVIDACSRRIKARALTDFATNESPVDDQEEESIEL